MEVVPATYLTEGEDAESYGPTNSALNNPVILQIIFCHLDTHYLKLIRTLCKMWDAIGSAILGNRCNLRFRDFVFSDYNKTTESVLRVNPKLLKHISFALLSDNCFTMYFYTSIPIWQRFVHELGVNLNSDMFNRLPEVLNAYGFPHLRKLAIRQQYIMEVKSCVPIRSLNTLRELKIVDTIGCGRANCSFLQRLINSAQNLEVLKIHGNYYPNFVSTCQRLKSLEWIGNPNTDGIRPIKLEEVFRILNEVSDRLEDLSIGLMRRGSAGYTYPDKLSTLPRFPKLKSFSINTVEVFNVLSELRPLVMPNLKTFKVEVIREHKKVFERISALHDYLKNGVKLTHEGLTSLELVGVNGLELINWTLQRFPNVNQLVIRIDNSREMISQDCHLQRIFEACSGWKLRNLEILIGYNFNMSEVMIGLKYLSVVGIKVLSIVDEKGGEDHRIKIRDDLRYECREFTDVFQLSSGMDSMIFKGLLLKPATAIKAAEYLGRHKDLPVRFLN